MRDYYQEPSATVYRGHAIDVLRELSPESVDCCVCSPPYWGLRSYKTEPIIWGDNNCEHEWGKMLPRAGYRSNDSNPGVLQGVATQNRNTKDSQFCLKCGAWKGELGLEPTIELYISHLLEIFDEVKRVLKKTGTLWVNIGDSYAGSGKASGQAIEAVTPKQASNFASAHIKVDYGQVPPKSLCLIPERFALGMVERGWILRNNIIWYKPNPMPESVKDRFTGSYEYLYFFTKAQRYWFEQQFEAHISIDESYFPSRQRRIGDGNFPMSDRQNHFGNTSGWNPLGRNKRDVWEINTQPYPEAHFAVFPEKLVKTPILAGCPSMICKKCGKARERIYEIMQEGRPQRDDNSKYKSLQTDMSSGQEYQNWRSAHPPIDKGYTDCGCNAGFNSGIVLDPFAGSGTTGLVAKKLGRKYIGIELNPKYCKMHVKRLQSVPMAMELA